MTQIDEAPWGYSTASCYAAQKDVCFLRKAPLEFGVLRYDSLDGPTK